LPVFVPFTVKTVDPVPPEVSVTDEALRVAERLVELVAAERFTGPVKLLVLARLMLVEFENPELTVRLDLAVARVKSTPATLMDVEADKVDDVPVTII
jgi:hypothetical protein